MEYASSGAGQQAAMLCLIYGSPESGQVVLDLIRDFYEAISGFVFPVLVAVAVALLLKWHIIPGAKLIRATRDAIHPKGKVRKSGDGENHVAGSTAMKAGDREEPRDRQKLSSR